MRSTDTITEADIAKQELRSLGLQFSMDSLQDAIYFLDERSIDLFHRAGVSTEDIYRALGEPHDFTGQEPLLIGLFERLDRLEGEIGGSNQAMDRARQLVKLIRDGAVGDQEQRSLSHPFLLYDSNSEPLPGESRSLLSYALEHHGGYVAAALLEVIFDKGDQVPLPSTSPNVPAAEERHAAVLIDPWRALQQDETSKSDFSPREQTHLMQALFCRGVRPLESTKATLVLEYEKLSDRDCPTEPVSVSTPVLPSQLRREVLDGIVIQTINEGCSVSPIQWHEVNNSGEVTVTQPYVAPQSNRNRLQRLMLPWSSKPPDTSNSIVSWERNGTLNGEAIKIVLQHMGYKGKNYVRIALDTDSPKVAMWRPITTTTVLLSANFPDLSLFLQLPTDSSITNPTSEPLEIDQNTEEKREISLPQDAVSVYQPLQIMQSTGIELQVSQSRGVHCVQIIRESSGTNNMEGATQNVLLGSTLISGTTSATLQIPLLPKEDDIRVEATRIEPGATDIQISVIAKDLLDCRLFEPGGSPPQLVPTWQQGVIYDGKIAPNTTIRCMIVDEEPHHIRVRLSGMNGDLDLKLLQLAASGNWEEIESSINGGTEAEAIQLLVQAGTYALDITSLAESESPFLLKVEEVKSPQVLMPSIDDPNLIDGRLDIGQTEDFFQIEIPELAQLTVDLSNLASDIDLAVLNEQYVDIVSSVKFDNTSERISIPIFGGTYYVKVYRNDDTVEARYTLTVRVAEPMQLGKLSLTIPLTHTGTVNSGEDSFYLFTASQPTGVQVRIEDMNADADLSLLDSSWNELASSTKFDLPDIINCHVSPGDYQVRVRGIADTPVSYRLTVAINDEIVEGECSGIE